MTQTKGNDVLHYFPEWFKIKFFYIRYYDLDQKDKMYNYNKCNHSLMITYRIKKLNETAIFKQSSILYQLQHTKYLAN